MSRDGAPITDRAVRAVLLEAAGVDDDRPGRRAPRASVVARMGGVNVPVLVAQRHHVEDLVREVLPGQHVQVTWTWRGVGASAGSRRGRAVIQLSDDTLGDAHLAAYVAVHEAGHIALGHVQHRARTVGIYVASLAACLAVATALLLTLAGTQGAGLIPASLLVWVAVQRPLLARLKQPQEYTADRFAARHGHPLTPRLAAMMWTPRSRRERLMVWLFPTHPSWDQRLAAGDAPGHHSRS